MCFYNAVVWCEIICDSTLQPARQYGILTSIQNTEL
jgi:hypothetical protein